MRKIMLLSCLLVSCGSPCNDYCVVACQKAVICAIASGDPKVCEQTCEDGVAAEHVSGDTCTSKRLQIEAMNCQQFSAFLAAAVK
jgi:hypothetical protein